MRWVGGGVVDRRWRAGGMPTGTDPRRWAVGRVGRVGPGGGREGGRGGAAGRGGGDLPLFEARLEGGRLGALEDLGDARPVGAALLGHVVLPVRERRLALVGGGALAHPHEDLGVVVHDEGIFGLKHILGQVARRHLGWGQDQG